MTAKGEVVPVLMASAPGGRDAPYLHLFINTPAGGIRCSNMREDLGSARLLPLAGFQLGIENS